MKKFYFLAGYSRSGNTFLSSLMNQNSNIIFTANSPVVDILWNLQLAYEKNWLINFPDTKGLKNVIDNFFGNYYSHYNADVIFDRGGWGTPSNLGMLKKIIKEPKFLLLVRPITEVLASYVKIAKPKNVEEFVNSLMHPDSGKIYWDWISTKNIIENHKKNYLIINYNSLVDNIEKSVKDIYSFFEIPYFQHNYNNINEFEINKIKYDDKLWNADLHKIKSYVFKEKYDITDYLPQNIINMYKNWDLF